MSTRVRRWKRGTSRRSLTIVVKVLWDVSSISRTSFVRIFRKIHGRQFLSRPVQLLMKVPVLRRDHGRGLFERDAGFPIASLPHIDPRQGIQRVGANRAAALSGASGKPFSLDRKSTRLNSSHMSISYAV